MTELLNFPREGREQIDDLLTRFDVIRQRANMEGGLAMNTQGITYILLKVCQANESQLLQLLQPSQGLFPASGAEYHALCNGYEKDGTHH